MLQRVLNSLYDNFFLSLYSWVMIFLNSLRVSHSFALSMIPMWSNFYSPFPCNIINRVTFSVPKFFYLKVNFLVSDLAF